LCATSTSFAFGAGGKKLSRREPILVVYFIVIRAQANSSVRTASNATRKRVSAERFDHNN
jgi:hypothetical protein